MLCLANHPVTVLPVFRLTLFAAVESFLAFRAAGEFLVFGCFFATVCAFRRELSLKLATLALAPEVE